MKPVVLKRLHEEEVMILNELDNICKEHQLTYYLCGGTLLGAVRHQGFIPWDDDVDVAMPRADFDRLKKNFCDYADKDYYLLSDETDNQYHYIHCKICKKNTLFVENTKVKSQNGIFIDIFPLDSGVCTYFFNRLKQKLYCFISFNLSLRQSNCIVPLKHKVFFIIPASLLKRFKKNILLGKGDYYINYGSQYGIKKQTIKKSCFNPSSLLMFEGKMYPVPKDYSFILKQIYGDDYMTLPPIEKRRTHNPAVLKFDVSGPNEVL